MAFLKKKTDLILLLFFLGFSWWLMNKSFGYRVGENIFWVARHQVGDFGLHLGLARSFSWGSNFPPESVFFPGRPLPYHYYFDFLAGKLESLGIRLDYAVNGLSSLFFAGLLFLIYKLPQLLFKKKSFLLGLTAVGLFLGNSSLAFLKFFSTATLSWQFFRNLWLMPDYLYKGPFDGSTISLLFTLNVFLNQRHLIVALFLVLLIDYFVLEVLLNKKTLSLKKKLFLGVLLGFTSRFHTLIFLSGFANLVLLSFLFKRWRFFRPVLLMALVIFSFHFRQILGQDLKPQFWHPGFLGGGLNFWWQNFSLALVTIPLGVFLASKEARRVFLAFLPLFLVANLFQFSFRIEHNHSAFNLFFIWANFYTAFFLWRLWRQKIWGKAVFFLLLFLLTFSGLLNLFAIKNDFQYPILDAAGQKLVLWLKENTARTAVFIAPEEILDPVVLAGRKNYFGHRYYLQVMGYDYGERQAFVSKIRQNPDELDLMKARAAGVDYLLLPVTEVKPLFSEKLPAVYKNDRLTLFKL